MGWLSEIMAKILIFFHVLVGSYGWSIVLLTFLLRLVLFPTSIGSIRSMEKMKAIQPKIKEIQAKYKDKPEELQRRTMEMYRENKVNPLGGCLPLLIQLPFMWALYGLLNNASMTVGKSGKPIVYFLGETANKAFTNEHFLGILQLTKKASDIAGPMLSTQKLSFLILAILSGATTFVQQKITSPQTAASTDGAGNFQSMFLYLMPLFFIWITYTMPAALGIYWVAQGVVGIVQQYIIVKFFMEHPTNPAALPEKHKKP